MAWRHTNSPVRVKAKRTISTRKVMATVFWDRHGVLLVEFMQQGTTINAAAYCATLTKLRRAIQNKRRGLLTSGVLLLHDNARPHSAINTKNLIRSFGWEQIDHPPYSPELSPSDFHLFRYLKEFLGGKRFDTADEVKEEVQDWLSSQAADVYDLGIQKLVVRYDKCLNKYGNGLRRKFLHIGDPSIAAPVELVFKVKPFLRSGVNEKFAQFCVTIEKANRSSFLLHSPSRRHGEWVEKGERGHHVTYIISMKKLDYCPSSDWGPSPRPGNIYA
ncbi:histone-lysine N-methyltransferase SETMAR [Trichonephila clavipes]|nr:histone-lysine N-methyltransferase SETMAR [Trichonephila clavipes]